MDRKSFIFKSIATSFVAISKPFLLKESSGNLSQSTYDQLSKDVGFNHIPIKENKKMNTVIHKNNTRGHANHGWLDSHHTFSFANYYHPERMSFGVLRVLNDDMVAPGKGFGKHPHDNMEIISIPLTGDLEHKDSMGNVTVIKEGDVQVMSAGTGVFHSEYNKNEDIDVKFLQIWLFPNQKQVTPRYDQISIEDLKRQNELYQILSPNEDDQGVWIHQDAWFNMGEFTQDTQLQYVLNLEQNGVYIFVLEGEVNINDNELEYRDGIGIWNTKSIQISAKTGSKILLMEVPMNI